MIQASDRRTALRAAAATGVAGAFTLSGGRSAEAAAVLQRLVMNRVIAYKYYSSTRVTVVTRYTPQWVVVKKVDTAYYLKNSAGAWVRIAYRWDRTKRALVYDRYLHLQLIQASAPLPPPPPPPAAGANQYVAGDADLHLVRRLTYGPTASEMASIKALGATAWLEQQMNPTSIDDTACEALIASWFPHQGKSIAQVSGVIERKEYTGWQQQMDVAGAAITRACWSKRQLLATMTDFWSNHFNVTVPSDPETTRHDLARVISANAFGRFGDLLQQAVLHPAMLQYLNNDSSDADHPNENLGRELLELHTVGVDAGYTETDVLNCARILTGLTITWPTRERVYDAGMHWVGPVRVLGFSDANATAAGGLDVATRLLAYLAAHPATARRVATKLVQHFVSDIPPPALVDSLTQVYLDTGGQIRPMLRHLFTSEAFATSGGEKLRRPYEHLVYLVRALGIGPGVQRSTIMNLYWMLYEAGNAPLSWPQPDGFPTQATSWSGTQHLLSRWNLTVSLVARWWPETLAYPDLSAHLFGGTVPATHGAMIDRAAMVLLRRTLLPEHKAELLVFLGSTQDQSISATTALAPDSQAMTWNLPYWVSALLSTPYTAYR